MLKKLIIPIMLIGLSIPPVQAVTKTPLVNHTLTYKNIHVEYTTIKNTNKIFGVSDYRYTPDKDTLIVLTFASTSPQTLDAIKNINTALQASTSFTYFKSKKNRIIATYTISSKTQLKNLGVYMLPSNIPSVKRTAPNTHIELDNNNIYIDSPLTLSPDTTKLAISKVTIMPLNLKGFTYSYNWFNSLPADGEPPAPHENDHSLTAQWTKQPLYATPSQLLSEDGKTLWYTADSLEWENIYINHDQYKVDLDKTSNTLVVTNYTDTLTLPIPPTFTPSSVNTGFTLSNTPYANLYDLVQKRFK